MEMGQYVESYRFWDVVTLWGRETLQHEIIVARALAQGVIRDGLRVQSVDPKWTQPGGFELRGAPFMGYVAKPGGLPIIIRATALRHLMAVVSGAAEPDPPLLYQEFITKQDFRAWVQQTQLRLPQFWFGSAERV